MIASWFGRLWHALCTFIYPKRCLKCGVYLPMEEQVILLCKACADQIRPPASLVLSVSKSVDMRLHAVFFYEPPFQQIIKAKFGHDLSYYAQVAHYLVYTEFFTRLKLDPTQTILTFVPCHWTRRLIRGFNQSEYFARLLGRVWHLPVNVLSKRQKRTALQVGLTAEQRQKNLENAFALLITEQDFIKDKHVVIIDDLCTSGTTLKALAAVLARGKPASLQAVVICRT